MVVGGWVVLIVLKHTPNDLKLVLEQFKVICLVDGTLFMQGNWYDLLTGNLVYSDAVAGGDLTVDAPLDAIPVFVRGGSILPWQEPATTTVERYLKISNQEKNLNYRYSSCMLSDIILKHQIGLIYVSTITVCNKN